jgi:hypothetical protein
MSSVYTLKQLQGAAASRPVNTGREGAAPGPVRDRRTWPVSIS